ncbi:hypothetical protein [Roseovarius sp.]|jgi:hypothetical protein
MRNAIRTAAVTFLLTATGQAAIAGQAEADACAASLTATGQTMYAAVAPSVSSGDNMKSEMRGILKPMVQSGSLTQVDARANAKAVIACLEKL